MLSFSRIVSNTTSQAAVLAMISALTACGGGSGSSGSNSITQSSAASVVEKTIIKGTVSKGVIQNGIVSIFGIDNGTPDSLLASAVTDNYGQFTAQITGYDGPVYIEVRAATTGEPTLMMCDVAAGCGTFSTGNAHDTNLNNVIDFGEQFAVSQDFLLTASLPASQLNSPTSISTLTHLATQFAAQFPQGINDISIAVAMSQIESLFGIDSSLMTLRAIDITDPTAVSNASVDELRYALLSGAIMGLTHDAAFTSTLNTLTTSFQINNGQLIQRDNDSTVPSYLNLVEQALATAQRLNLTGLVSEFQQLSLRLLAADPGSLTEAQPSATAGGEAAAKIAAFLDDLALWQGYLSLNPNQTSFGQMVNTLGISTGTDMSHMLQVLAIAGQYGPIVALPDLALGAACDSLENFFARLTCRSLIANKSLQEICEGAGNLVLFGRSLCEILNDLTLPLGAGLYGHFALYDGIVRIQGTIEGADVNVTFVRAGRNRTHYSFSVAGTIETDTGSLSIDSGNINLLFTGGLDIKNLKLPEFADGNFTVHYSQAVDAENSNPMQFAGSINLSLDLSNVRTAEDNSALVGLEQIGLSLTADGEFSTALGNSFTGALSLNGGMNSNIVMEFQTDLPDYSGVAVVSLTSTPVNLANGVIDTIQMNWAGKRYEVLNFADEHPGIRISNQDGIILDLDLSVEDGALAGYLLLNGTRYGSVSPLNGSLLFTLADGSERVL